MSSPKQWNDLIDRHPFKGEVRLQGEATCRRCIEDWELIEVLALPVNAKKGRVLVLQAYIRLKLLTGLVRNDLLSLNPCEDFKDDGIHVTRHKLLLKPENRPSTNGMGDVRAAVAAAIKVRPATVQHLLFYTRAGASYIDPVKERASWWDSMWKRFVIRVMEETKLTERFTEHDLRAECASDAGMLEYARARLPHVDSRVTNLIYRRRPDSCNQRNFDLGAIIKDCQIS